MLYMGGPHLIQTIERSPRSDSFSFVVSITSVVGTGCRTTRLWRK